MKRIHPDGLNGPGSSRHRYARPPLGPVIRALALGGAMVLSPLTSQAGAEPLDCMIQPNQLVQIGVPAPGVIDRIQVDRGDLVTKGQIVAQLNASVERAALAVARERAAQQAERSVAESSQAFAHRELQRANELREQEFVSQTYLDKSRVELEMASGRSGQAHERQRLARREVDLAAAQLEQRTIRSPIEGVVVERYLSPGEFVDQKPVLRLAELDPLRVDVLVPAANFGLVEVGSRARVTTDIGGHRELIAEVRTVDRLIDAASNTFRVRMELKNPGAKIPAGLRCKADLGLGALTSAAAGR